MEPGLGIACLRDTGAAEPKPLDRRPQGAQDVDGIGSAVPDRKKGD
jgi:hypothetical protein